MADDVRTRILEAAVACLGSYGIAKPTVDDVARRAGVARETVYRHFPGKAAVLAAILQGASRTLLDGAERLRRTSNPSTSEVIHRKS